MLLSKVKVLLQTDAMRIAAWWKEAPFVRSLLAIGAIGIVSAISYTFYRIAPHVHISLQYLIAYTAGIAFLASMTTTILIILWQKRWLAVLPLYAVSNRAASLWILIQSFFVTIIAVVLFALPFWLFRNANTSRLLFSLVIVVLASHILGVLAAQIIAGLFRTGKLLTTLVILAFLFATIGIAHFAAPFLPLFTWIAQFITIGTLFSAFGTLLFLALAVLLYRVFAAGSFQYASQSVAEVRPFIQVPKLSAPSIPNILRAPNEAWYIVVLSVSIVLLVLIARGIIHFSPLEALPRSTFTLFLFVWITLLTATFLWRTVVYAKRFSDILFSTLPYFFIGTGTWLAMPYLNELSFRMVGVTFITQFVMACFFYIPRHYIGATKEARRMSVLFIIAWVVSIALLLWQR